MAARNAPLRFWALKLNAAWLTGLAEVEHENLVAQYDWFDDPVVAVGDFNTAPWSGSMRDSLVRTGFRTLRRTFGSWPASLGRLGVPIDHVLIHNGARVVALEICGDGLGSNHRGFVADIAVP